MKLVIEQSVTIYASAGWLWNALTDASELENWWGEDIVLQAKVGGQFREPWEDDDGNDCLASGKVLSVKKEKQITFSWKEKGWPPKSITECSFEIEDKGKSCVLKVTHSGWETLPEKLQKPLMKDFKVGWGYHLKELKEYLEY